MGDGMREPIIVGVIIAALFSTTFAYVMVLEYLFHNSSIPIDQYRRQRYQAYGVAWALTGALLFAYSLRILVCGVM
jgi:hypothetical protein